MIQSDTLVVIPSSVPAAAPRHINHSVDTLAVLPSTASAASPTVVHLNGSEEDVPNSMASEEVFDAVHDKRVPWNLSSREGPTTSAPEEDAEPYIMPELPNLDSIVLRGSSRAPKSSAVVLYNKRQQKEVTHRKTNLKRELYGLFTMLTLCTALLLYHQLLLFLLPLIIRWHTIHRRSSPIWMAP